MKTNAVKLITVIIAIIICAAAAVTGLTAGAADCYNAAGTGNASLPAIGNGIWQVEGGEYDRMYVLFDGSESSMLIVRPDMGVGTPCRYEYNPYIGMYRIYVGSPDNEINWRVIDNCGDKSVVIDENGDTLILNRVSEDTDRDAVYKLCG